MYGCKPDLTREGGSIPVTLTFQETTGTFPTFPCVPSLLAYWIHNTLYRVYTDVFCLGNTRIAHYVVTKALACRNIYLAHILPILVFNCATPSYFPGKSVMLLPMGAGDDGAHSQNEKINMRNYIEGVSY